MNEFLLDFEAIDHDIPNLPIGTLQIDAAMIPVPSDLIRLSDGTDAVVVTRRFEHNQRPAKVTVIVQHKAGARVIRKLVPDL